MDGLDSTKVVPLHLEGYPKPNSEHDGMLIYPSRPGKVQGLQEELDDLTTDRGI